MAQENKIPHVTAKRLPLYYRYLEKLHLMGKQRVSSAQLSKELLIDPATIRRDFSYLGELGKKGYGYNVSYLLQFLRDFLKQDEVTNVILIGVGNLGKALLHYNFYKSRNTKIVAAFDSDPNKFNREIDGIPVYGMESLKEVVDLFRVEVAILTVPVYVAQQVTDQVVEAGVKGILNFTPSRLTVPPNVRVHHIDLTTELQTLVYFLKNPNVLEEEKETEAETATESQFDS
ncbi:redox-sensing transcriptional repressor Rex [Tepidibacillus fermentans]|uniref:Redox-sensing transcriptional repressor Rex n=1 Tax=Tepidibacillus fermentans TaxID=1281767 RepID=A0A4R3K9I9_9BACI|nr:redox-sensing transcriptional repressor Rex [Tepidibacillus fermentans]TCS79565.1 redox-sensing transcriptional repressor [Tepidibacillus fermentans]